jgi:hypothetical protein
MQRALTGQAAQRRAVFPPNLRLTSTHCGSSAKAGSRVSPPPLAPAIVRWEGRVARYYFNIDDGSGLEDMVGMELSA